MSQPLLSILICALDERAGMLAILLRSIEEQVEKAGAKDKIEVLVEMDNRKITTGTKRNILLNRAKGVYTVFADDDDWLSPHYIKEIVKACESNCDVVGYKGWMTTNKNDRVDWKISKDLPYREVFEEGKRWYYRFNNHLSPIKREIALQIMFKDITHGEDYDYSVRLKESGLIKTEVFIDEFLYHYKFISNK